MAAAAYPPWVILDEHCTLEVQGSSLSIADANTLARCRTSTGHPIDVSVRLAAPPEVSRVCVQLPRGIEATSYNALVVAAHGDSVLVTVTGMDNGAFLGTAETGPIDHFVYNAGDAAAEPPRPPSLSLLRPHSIAYEDERRLGCSGLNVLSTGLLRRGDGDFLVAELKMERVKESDGTVHNEAALHLLRSVSCKWCVKQPVTIIGGNTDAGEFFDDYLVSSWQNNMVVPVGDQVLCWVDMARGLLLSGNLFDESPSLRYLPFPMDANYFCARSVFATADGRTIKLINAFPRCSCGGDAGKSKHRASHIHTWTMRMDDVEMAWVIDGSLDSDQLWDLDGYKGIPRVVLESPVVCMDEPNAICFVVCERDHDDIHGEETMLRIIVDMNNKTLRSVFRSPKPGGQRFDSYYGADRYFPSRVSKYFNCKPSSGQPAGLAAQAEAMQSLMSSGIENKLQANNDTAHAASPEAAILAALQEIPSLDHDDMMKAYRILTNDSSGRRFRSLMGLPKDLRKDWVLMEIKASEACVLCSACSTNKRKHQ